MIIEEIQMKEKPREIQIEEPQTVKQQETQTKKESDPSNSVDPKYNVP